MAASNVAQTTIDTSNLWQMMYMLTDMIDGTDDFFNSYTYDSLNRLTQLDQEGQTGGNSVAEKRVDFAYNLANQFTTIARYNDTAGGSSSEVATSTYTYATRTTPTATAP